MTQKLKFSVDELNKITDGRLHSPIQDVVGADYSSVAKLAVSADTEYLFECDGSIRNFKVLPDHITNMWNIIDSKATFEDFLNTPEIVANIQFKFDPTSASGGLVSVHAYINEPVPVLIKTVTVPFKGEETNVQALLTFYTGEESGYDLKNKGVIFKFESTLAGQYWDPKIEIYRT